MWTEEQRPESEQYRIDRRQIGCTSTRSIDDQKLLLQEKVIGDDGPGAAGSEEVGERCQKLGEYHQ